MELDTHWDLGILYVARQKLGLIMLWELDITYGLAVARLGLYDVWFGLDSC